MASVLRARRVADCRTPCEGRVTWASVVELGTIDRRGWIELGRLDIGQAVAIKETEVIAVEAIEGTDRMIERAGALCKQGGWCLIKVAKPNQDMRFDVPTIGPETIDNLHRHGARMLVIEAGKTVIIDRDKTLSAAAKHGIIVVARTP